MKRIGILFVLCCVFALLRLDAQPTVSVTSVENITATTAKFWGSITDLGSKMSEIKKRGFIIAPYDNVSVGDTLQWYQNAAKKNEMYSFEITNLNDYLTPGTHYWVMAFINFKKTGSDTEYVYSSKFDFYTQDPINDYATASFVETVSLTTASLKGTIDSAGNATELVDCGFVYSLSSNPVIGSAGSEYTRSTFNANNVYPKTITSDIINLSASTTYYYRVWTVCKYTETFYDTTYSAQKSFTTLHACGLVPQKLDTVFVGVDQAELKWEAREGQTKFEVEYGLSGHKVGEGDTIIVEDTHVLLDSLESNRSYTSYVRAVCPDMTSEWSLMRPFHTLTAPCEKVLGLHLDHATHVTAKVVWSPGQEGEHQWEVLFARSDDSYPQNPFFVSEDPVFFPIGLTINTEYKVQVRTVCTVVFDTFEIDEEWGDTIPTTSSYDIYGLWSDELVFSTAASSLEDGMEVDCNVSIYPNPASGIIRFSSKNNLPKTRKIEIFSEMGTLVYSNDELPEELDTSLFGKGAFIVHITTPKGVQVEKIIVK